MTIMRAGRASRRPCRIRWSRPLASGRSRSGRDGTVPRKAPSLLFALTPRMARCYPPSARKWLIVKGYSP